MTRVTHGRPLPRSVAVPAAAIHQRPGPEQPNRQRPGQAVVMSQPSIPEPGEVGPQRFYEIHPPLQGNVFDTSERLRPETSFSLKWSFRNEALKRVVVPLITEKGMLALHGHPANLLVAF